MKVHSLHLKNTAHFSNLNLQFSLTPPITLIVGAQATGKTTLLKHLFHGLSWFSARYKDARTAGIVMPDQDISIGQSHATIEITVQVPAELGQLSESPSQRAQITQQCQWSLHKILKADGVGMSQVDTQQLEELSLLYQRALQKDQLQSLPVIAYYPADRFVHEIQLLNKNNSANLQPHAAYDLTPLPYTTFIRFFEWLREIHDIENSCTTQQLQDWLNQQADDLSLEQLKMGLAQFKHQHHSPHLKTLNYALNRIFPEISELYLQYQPKLQLMLTINGQKLAYQQLSNSLKTWIALVGDFVRRLCLLNPHQLYPCLEAEGILLIDAIDQQLDPLYSAEILRRLHEVFPHIQIIATTHQEDLLEYATDYQCLRLNQQQLYPIHLQKVQHQFDAIYAHLNQPIIHSDSSLYPLPLDNAAMLEHFLHQIQEVLSPEQQQELIRRLNAEPDTPSLKF